MSPKFIHLHVHSEFSLIDGLIRFKPLVSHCTARSIAALALTDYCNLFGMVKFYKQALQAGIKPIIGAEIPLHNPEDENQPFKSVLLCQNQIGYKNLTRLISQAYLKGQATGKPRVSAAWLEEFNEGLIMLSGAQFGDVGQAILARKPAEAETLLKNWAAIFADRFYIELIRSGRPQEENYIQSVLPLAQRLAIPVVATNDVRFLQPDDFEAHEARVCIHDAYVLEDSRRPRVYSEQQYLRDEKEMLELFQDIPSAITNTVEIAKRCNLELNLDKAFLPDFPVPEHLTIEAYFKQQSEEGLHERLQQIKALEKRSLDPQAYYDRLRLELDVINKMGFAGYFLIVADFIAWARNNDVPVGPGRGSGAGSLVAYALKITDLDPLKYDLLFERFLNPERISMPDFDVDFCMEGRDRVIEYVAQKYGRNSVSQIITFGTLAAKAVIRDVGRVLGFPYGFVDKIAKLIPFEVGMTLEKALAQEEMLRERYEKEDDVRGLIDLARKLEGIARNAGKHAGGVVISPSDLTDFSPLYCEAGSEHIVTQFDKDDVEAVGLVKFDFLGLRTLTIIDWTLKTINAKREARGEESLSLLHIPEDDSKTFELLKQCATTGVFQLESRGMKDLIKRLQPDCFEDIIALVALFRPGPLQSGMVDDFINRKHGRAKIEYPHPALEPILKPTYGVILYQEQVMQIAQVLAGYTLGGADMLRRAMGKKKPEEMAKQRSIFVDGAQKNHIDADLADQIFSLMEKFAGYGFNKSHSAAYAYVSYQTAWLKAHFPAAFMAAVLSSEMDHTDKIIRFIDECQQMRLTILSPDINRSYYKFTIVDISTLLYGLGAVKGVGEAAIEHILENREKQGAFKDIFDFCLRVDLRKVNRRVLEALINAGAFDQLGPHRAAIFAAVENAMAYAEQQAKNDDSGQNDLFAAMPLESDAQKQCRYPQVSSWPDEELLEREKATLGFYFSGHPIDCYRDELRQFISEEIAHLPLDSGKTLTIAGLINAVRTLFTKRGDRMAFITLSDKSGRLEFAVFSDLYEKNRAILQKDQIVVIEAESHYDENAGVYKISARNILSLEDARANYVKYICLQLRQQQVEQNFIDDLQNLLEPFRYGNCPVLLQYQTDSAKARIELHRDWWVFPNDKLIKTLQQFLGAKNVLLNY